MDENEQENESLKDEMRNVIEEARMILPGVQALFGFQTMAVFNNRFEELASPSRFAYLAALGLLTLAMGLLMTPAAYNRLAERGKVSRYMINLSSTRWCPFPAHRARAVWKRKAVGSAGSY